MLEMEQEQPKARSIRDKTGLQIKTATSTVGRKRSNRGLVCLILLALVVFTSKDNLVRLDQFLIASDATGQSGSQSSINGTIQRTSINLHGRRTASSLVSKQSATYPPLSCSDIFYEDRNQPRPFGDPNLGGMYARYIKTDPSFWVSLHDRTFDGVRWSIMQYGYYYESVQTVTFMDIVRDDVQQRRSQQPSTPPPIRVIDVGGNIGWYTLVVIAAAAEQKYPIIVDVFEPNPRNHPRFCESLFLNEWLHHDQVAVNLYPIGVTSNQMATSNLTGRMDLATSGSGSLDAMNLENTTGTIAFPLVSLDRMSKELDWMEHLNQNVSILKVDVEGFELEVFQGAQELLKSKTVQNIFFEGNMRTDAEKDKFHQIVNSLLNCGYVAYKVGGFRGPVELVQTVWNASSSLSQSSAAELGTILANYSSDLLKECVGLRRQKRTQCNMWWRPL